MSVNNTWERFIEKDLNRKVDIYNLDKNVFLKHLDSQLLIC